MSEEAVQAAEAAPETPDAVEQVSEAAAETAAQPDTAATAAAAAPAPAEEAPVDPEDVSYQAVEKEGTVTAIWEMAGQRHLRTINPRSHEGKQILALFETAG